MNIPVTSLLPAEGTFFSRPRACVVRRFRTTLFAISAYPRSHHISCTVSWAENCLAPAKYLALVGVIPLRFALPPEPATERPVALIPAAPMKISVPESHDVSPVAAATPEPTHLETAKAETVSPFSDEKPVSILPDDTPRDVKAEDILPYFQMPRNSAPISGVALPFTPASPTLPASSATYELK